MKYILGTKKQMTQIFTEEGRCIPVTIVQADPNIVTQIKTLEKDGYDAAQFACGIRKEKNISKAQKGHFKDMGNFAHVHENRVSEEEIDVQKGDSVNVSVFEEGDKVHITSVSKGKGFQGVVKRHGFHGGPRSHGQKHNERTGGSIGSGGVQRVIKGMKMPGRMGSDKITVKNLKIVKIDIDKNMLYVKGAVPGIPGSLVEIVGK